MIIPRRFIQKEHVPINRNENKARNAISASAMPRSFGMSISMRIPKRMRNRASETGSSGRFIKRTKLDQLWRLDESKPNVRIILDWILGGNATGIVVVGTSCGGTAVSIESVGFDGVLMVNELI